MYEKFLELMKITKKIDAFTLSELLVVLVISSIVISMSFLILSMVQKQVQGIRENLHYKQELQLLEQHLWKDFNTHTIEYFKNKDALLVTNSIDSLNYYFYGDYIVREKDTFSVKINSKQLFLNGEEVKTGYIDAIKLETSPIFGNTKLFISKTKDASFYLNN